MSGDNSRDDGGEVGYGPDAVELGRLDNGSDHGPVLGSDYGGQRATLIYPLIVIVIINDVDPQAWLTDVLGCIAGHPAAKFDYLLPRNWKLQIAVAG